MLKLHNTANRAACFEIQKFSSSTLAFSCHFKSEYYITYWYDCRCDNGRMIVARPAESYIMVLAPQTPSILLNGSEDLARDYTHFRAGLTVFPDLTVRVLAPGNERPLPGKETCLINNNKNRLLTHGCVI